MLKSGKGNSRCIGALRSVRPTTAFSGAEAHTNIGNTHQLRAEGVRCNAVLGAKNHHRQGGYIG
jgi:hypothetical protein